MRMRELRECDACHGKKYIPVVDSQSEPVMQDGQPHYKVVMLECRACDGKGQRFVEV